MVEEVVLVQMVHMEQVEVEVVGLQPLEELLRGLELTQVTMEAVIMAEMVPPEFMVVVVVIMGGSMVHLLATWVPVMVVGVD
jgi:hypothetical protein